MSPDHHADPGADTHDTTILASWQANAEAWTRVVRDGLLPSRRLGTDAAVLDACAAALPSPQGARILDLGCGEGWLARALAASGAEVLGIDGSEPLIATARNARPVAGTGRVTCDVVTYEALVASQDTARGPFDLVVASFALIAQDIVPTLAAVRRRLAPGGRLVVQTVHPWVAAGDAYVEGWRVESFDGFGVPFPSPMPWWFRTLEGWVAALTTAGYAIVRVHEPLHPESRRPLSLVLTLGSGPAS